MPEIIPVKTSPEPAFAIELFPVVFVYSLLSGLVINVLWVFSTVTQLNFLVIALALSSTSFSTLSKSVLSSLAASLG